MAWVRKLLRIPHWERVTGYTEVGGHSDLSFRFADDSEIGGDEPVYEDLP
jgi:hypothetical protein